VQQNPKRSKHETASLEKTAIRFREKIREEIELEIDLLSKAQEDKKQTSSKYSSSVEREEQSTETVKPSKRRLDSLARFLSISETCAAVCYDGRQLLIANNSGDKESINSLIEGLKYYIENKEKCNPLDLYIQYVLPIALNNWLDIYENQQALMVRNSEIQQKLKAQGDSNPLSEEESAQLARAELVLNVFEDLKYFNDKRYTIMDSEEENTEWWLHHDRLIKNATILSKNKDDKQVLKIAKNIIRPKKDLEKILIGLKTEKDINVDIITAIKDQKVLFLENPDELHAEMVVLKYLIENSNIPEPKAKIEGYEFGISKLTCCQCDLALKLSKSLIDKEIWYRGTHGYTYPNWKPPEFLLDNIKEIGNNFITATQDIRKKLESKEIGFVKGSDDSEMSPSPPHEPEDMGHSSNPTHEGDPTRKTDVPKPGP